MTGLTSEWTVFTLSFWLYAGTWTLLTWCPTTFTAVGNKWRVIIVDCTLALTNRDLRDFLILWVALFYSLCDEVLFVNGDWVSDSICANSAMQDLMKERRNVVMATGTSGLFQCQYLFSHLLLSIQVTELYQTCWQYLTMKTLLLLPCDETWLF